jgi:hypothetical protein
VAEPRRVVRGWHKTRSTAMQRTVLAILVAVVLVAAGAGTTKAEHGDDKARPDGPRLAAQHVGMRGAVAFSHGI